jgi:gliding motility-associated-like protein
MKKAVNYFLKMKNSFLTRSILCLFLLIGVFNNVKSHSVQVAYCVDCAGNLRIFIEHWHSTEAANTTSMTISLAVNNVTTTQTQSPVANIQNVTLANLPGCSTPVVSVAGCTGQMNTYNDWVYFDYTGLPAGVPISFTILSGSNVFTQDGCSMYPLTVTFTIPLPTSNNTPISVCLGQLTPSLGVPAGVNWTNTNPGIGLPASGTGSIAPFVATGPASGVITYTNGCGIQNTTITTVSALTLTPSSNSPCSGGNLSLTTSAAASYTWEGPNSFTSNLQNPVITGASTLATGAYTVTGASVSGCTANAVVNVVVNPTPTVTISSTKDSDCHPFCSDFTFSSSTPAQSYSWTLGNGMSGSTSTGLGCFNTVGTYTVNAEITDINGCVNSATYAVEVFPIPIADFNHAPIKPIVNIDPGADFTDASYGANVVGWNWYFMNTAEYTSTLQNPSFVYTEPGTYAVALVVTSDKGCMDTIVRKLVVGEDFGIYVPNAFTPSHDGLNDLFQPKGFGIVKYELNIFDRWGERVFHTTTFEEGWDGTFQGRKGDLIIEEGVYTWIINLTSVFEKSHELKGHVTLMK